MQAHLFDFPVHLVSQDEAVSMLQQAIVNQQRSHVVTLNPEMIMQANHEPALDRLLKQADLIIPDGAGVVWALKLLGYPQAKRLPGIELSEGLLQRAQAEHWRVALIGANPEVMTNTVAQLQKRYPGLDLCFTHHGYFPLSEEDAIAKACAQTKPHILLIGLGVPRQEYWIEKYRALFGATALVGVGGSFDVWSGLKKRAPDIFLKLHLEWLYRITSEPWRIKRVYKPLPLFVVKVLKHRFGR